MDNPEQGNVVGVQMRKMESYRTQLFLFRKMFEISVNQEEAIKREDYKKLLLLLQEREKIMKQITKIKQDFSVPQNPETEEEQDIVEQIVDLVERIFAQDKNNESLLQKGMDKISGELQQLGKAKLSQRAYAELSHYGAKFLDQRT